MSEALCIHFTILLQVLPTCISHLKILHYSITVYNYCLVLPLQQPNNILHFLFIIIHVQNVSECYYGTKYSSSNVNAGTKSNAKYIRILPPARKCQGLKRSEQNRHFPLTASGICIVSSYFVLCMLTVFFDIPYEIHI